MNYRPSGFIIAREAWPFAIPVAVLMVAVSFLSGLLTLLFGVVLLYILVFFRNPQRSGPTDADTVLAPADGQIVAAGIVAHPDFPEGQALRVAIFMNLFNVHVNWAPVSGEISAASHHSGKFINAMVDKCADENERKVLVMRTERNQPVVVKLVAGLIARRIVCPLERGDRVKKGDKIGLIRFGSRVETILPADSALDVQVGQHVRGGETVIAKLGGLPAGARARPEAAAQEMADAPAAVSADS